MLSAIHSTGNFFIGALVRKSMNIDNEERLGYSLKECAQQVPVSVAFLRKEIKRGKLKKADNFGDRVIILVKDWQEYVFGLSGVDN